MKIQDWLVVLALVDMVCAKTGDAWFYTSESFHGVNGDLQGRERLWGL